MARVSTAVEAVRSKEDYFVRVNESVPPDGSPVTPKPLVQSRFAAAAVDVVESGDQRKLLVLTVARSPMRVESDGYAESPTSFVVTEPAEPVDPATWVTSPVTLK